MHAYLLMVHKNQEQVENLLRLLDDKHNDIYIHCDKKWAAADTERLRGCLRESGMFFTGRTDVRWGDVSQINCELLLLEAAAGNHYEYYHLLSGQDLPLKPQREIRRFFADNGPDKNYIGFSSDPSFAAAQIAYRLNTYHLFRRAGAVSTLADQVGGKLQKTLGVRRMKDGREYGYGSNWFSINDALAQYVVRESDAIRREYRNTLCADEIFLQSLVLRSPFRDSLYTDARGERSNLRCIRWTGENRDNPYVFREKDYDDLLASGCLFARKFDPQEDPVIIQRITRLLLDETDCQSEETP